MIKQEYLKETCISRLMPSHFQIYTKCLYIQFILVHNRCEMGLAKVALTQNMTVFLHEQPKPWKHDPYVHRLSIKKIQMHSANGQASILCSDISTWFNWICAASIMPIIFPPHGSTALLSLGLVYEVP